MNYAASLSAQALARIVYVVSGALVFVLLARVLGPPRFGEYVFATNLIVVLCGLADLGLTAILARDLVVSGERRAAYFADFLVLRVIMGIVLTGPALVAVAVLSPGDLLVPLIAASLALPLIAARFFDPIFQVVERPWLSLLLSGCYAAVLVVGTTSALLITASPIYWAVVVYVICGVLYGAVGLWLGYSLIRPRFRYASLPGIRNIVYDAWPYCVGSLFAMLSTRLDVFLLEALGTPAMVGRYNAAFRFVDLGMAVIVTALTPLISIFAKLAAADLDALRRAFRAMMHFVTTYATAMAVLSPTLSPLLMRVVFGAEYEAAAPTLNVLAWKCQISFINLLMFAALMAVGSIRFNWWNCALAMALNVSANLVLIPVLGILGAGIASVVSELGPAAIVLFFLRTTLAPTFDVLWWIRLAFASTCASAVAYAPVEVDRIWMLAPAALAFFGLMHIMKAIPPSPLRAIRAEMARVTPNLQC